MTKDGVWPSNTLHMTGMGWAPGWERDLHSPNPGVQPSSVLARAVGQVCPCPHARQPQLRSLAHAQLLYLGPSPALLTLLTLPRYEQNWDLWGQPWALWI